MKVQINKTNKGFTLIEMIGVLAVIAILAALLIPKVFQAINEARINTVPVGAATVKTAIIDHYAKYGALNTLQGGTPFANMGNYDQAVLMVEGFLDKPFAPRVGTSANVILTNIGATILTTADVAVTEGVSYRLAGAPAVGASTAVKIDTTGSHLVYALIQGVAAADAQAISMRIDGAVMSNAEGVDDNDYEGRVKYAKSTAGVTDVYIYLTHR